MHIHLANATRKYARSTDASSESLAVRDLLKFSQFRMAYSCSLFTYFDGPQHDVRRESHRKDSRPLRDGKAYVANI